MAWLYSKMISVRRCRCRSLHISARLPHRNVRIAKFLLRLEYASVFGVQQKYYNHMNANYGRRCIAFQYNANMHRVNLHSGSTSDQPNGDQAQCSAMRNKNRRRTAEKANTKDVCSACKQMQNGTQHCIIGGVWWHERDAVHMIWRYVQ